MKSQQKENQEPLQTIRDPVDGQLKTTIPNPHEKKAEEQEKKVKEIQGS